MYKVMNKFFFLILSFSFFLIPKVQAANLEKIESFGSNPSNLEMYVYIPETLAENASLLVAVHYCTGSAQAFFNGSQFRSFADKHGFAIIYPSVTRASKCFDVSSPEALTRGGGSDPVGILSMVNYVFENYDVNQDKVYVTGVSSGAMMTNVLLALYPDVFEAGAAYAGVPYSCFAMDNGSEWNSVCSSGNLIKSAEEWGDAVRNANPGYSGPWPRIQLWHGSNDTVLHYNNFGEAIKQWTNVHGISDNPVLMDEPEANATRTRYGNDSEMPPVEAISLAGVPHNLPVNAGEAIRFFGLDKSTPSEVFSEKCNWYGTIHPICINTDTGWGYEFGESCIGKTTCSELPPPYGIVDSGTSPTPTPVSTPTATPVVTVTPTVIPTPTVTPTSAPVTPTPTVTPEPGVGQCVYSVTNDWGNGFTAKITINNSGGAAINGWVVSWSYAGNTAVTNLWNAELESSNPYTASDLGWNAGVVSGGSVSFGFQGTKDSGPAEMPVVSGAVCD